MKDEQTRRLMHVRLSVWRGRVRRMQRKQGVLLNLKNRQESHAGVSHRSCAAAALALFLMNVMQAGRQGGQRSAMPLLMTMNGQGRPPAAGGHQAGMFSIGSNGDECRKSWPKRCR